MHPPCVSIRLEVADTEDGESDCTDNHEDKAYRQQQAVMVLHYASHRVTRIDIWKIQTISLIFFRTLDNYIYSRGGIAFVINIFCKTSSGP